MLSGGREVVRVRCHSAVEGQVTWHESLAPLSGATELAIDLYFLSEYPAGHFGLAPVTFFDNLPFTQVIVLFTVFFNVVVVVGCSVVVVVIAEVVVVVATASA